MIKGLSLFKDNSDKPLLIQVIVLSFYGPETAMIRKFREYTSLSIV